MSGDWELPRLCRLVEELLHPYFEPAVGSVSLTREKEKNLLIALSKVYREIQVWIREMEVDSDEETTSSECSLEVVHEEHNCLMKVLADLILLLTVDSQYVQHSVGKIVVAVSELLAPSVRNWDSLVHSLWISLELIVKHVLSCSAISNAGDDLHFGTSGLMVLNRYLGNADWSTAAHIIQILRNILKSLKEESDDQLLQVYEKYVYPFLSNVPWDRMDECCTKEPNIVFLGSLITFLCSLVEQTVAPETKVHLQDKHPTLPIVINLVPKLFRWCLGKAENRVKQSTFQYFTHKLLMLLLRLSYGYGTHISCTTLVSWLQLLHDYFEELLLKPMSRVKTCQNDCLEGSPFLSSFSEGEAQHMRHSLHSQRQAILLFLRCCFSLISSTGENTKQLPAAHKSLSAVNVISDPDFSGRSKGFIDLYKWFQAHLRDSFLCGKEMHVDKCILFARSFLQLYLHEDDLLFKVLLQLVTASSCLEQQLEGEKQPYQDAEEDIGFLVSNAFSPVSLFHLFLSEVHYDHQVLLDYLISKDLGISCAEYLLRCLRITCSAWHLFIEFSVEGNAMDSLSRKKQKNLEDGPDFQADQSPGSPTMDTSPSLNDKVKIDTDSSYKQNKCRRLAFIEAKDCLLSLKVSIENLHRKNLFPYNPKALLQRLTKFEELCSNHDDFS
ncbi:unnamed protein product [Linum tenue]|uniref:Protein Lines C-terminal domain-containing protein n=1 Tax=Linum tenue TaxID=586396 RepID=A0AAV0RAF2_9ROSI|nr:unnamed protein product [Linum tenue]